MLLGLITTKKERQRAEAQRLEERAKILSQAQTQLGEELYSKLSRAASKNQVFNQYRDGRKENRIGPMRVEQRRDNGGSYTVLVSIDDSTCFTFGGFNTRGYPLVQTDINATKNRLHVFYCPYGPDRDYQLLSDDRTASSTFDDVTRGLVDFVKDYRLLRG